MATPLIAGTIMDTRKNKQGQKLEPRVYKNKYFDGVHATDDTFREWVSKFAYAINKNRSKAEFPSINQGLGPDFGDTDTDSDEEFARHQEELYEIIIGKC